MVKVSLDRFQGIDLRQPRMRRRFPTSFDRDRENPDRRTEQNDLDQSVLARGGRMKPQC
jgi:hypothetical protein